MNNKFSSQLTPDNERQIKKFRTEIRKKLVRNQFLFIQKLILGAEALNKFLACYRYLKVVFLLKAKMNYDIYIYLSQIWFGDSINNYLRLNSGCVYGIFNLKCLLIEFVIPNLSQNFFCIPEIFKTNVSNRFLSTKSTFEFVF